MHIDLSCIYSCPNALQEITGAILAAASGHLETLMGDVETLKVQTGAERLTNYLLSRLDLEQGGKAFELPFEKVVLAGKLGMKPESLSRAFARLKPFGVNSDKRHVTIDDIARFRSATNHAGLMAP